MEDSLNTKRRPSVPCDRCAGSGKYKDLGPCVQCSGKGVLNRKRLEQLRVYWLRQLQSGECSEEVGAENIAEVDAKLLLLDGGSPPPPATDDLPF